ncbi:hypothetical protein TREES_T100000554 [Tupaia chinensis]|uniref:Uncharacterized protein n=1 Tax=Tupaia chinensis TaxID=246437 RepID=L9KT79_TUPCH|nr:hypothetical protein TREES_T100000554 [Tupaia chinensis]
MGPSRSTAVPCAALRPPSLTALGAPGWPWALTLVVSVSVGPASLALPTARSCVSGTCPGPSDLKGDALARSEYQPLLQVTSAACRLPLKPGPTRKQLFLICELFRRLPGAAVFAWPGLGAVAWPCSRRASSLPSPAPPAAAAAAATMRGSRGGPGIVPAKAAGGGGAPEGRKCEPEGQEGLETEEAPPASAGAWGWLGFGGPQLSRTGRS